MHSMKDFFRNNKGPLAVAALAVIVRWIYIAQMAGHAGFTVPMVDEKWHWQWALDIIDGPFFGSGAWFRAPLYPYFLAFLAFITGKSILWAKLLQVIVCGGTAFFLYKLTDRLIGGRAAIIAGVIYAFYGTLMYYEAMFLIPVLFLFFTVWGMYRLIACADSHRAGTWLLTGVVFGLAAISRPNILLVVPVLLLWVWLALDREKALVARLRRPILIGVGLAIAIAPVTIRNLAVTGNFILISSQGGINFYLGNNPAANGLAMRMPDVELSEDLSWSQFQPTTDAAAEREAGRPLTQSEISSFWTDKAVDWITNNPGKFLGLVWRRLVYLASGFENSDNSDIYYERGKSWLYALLLWHKGIAFPFGVLLPLALAGVYIRRRDWRKLLPMYLFVVVYVPTIILFLVTARHRLPLVPFLILLASATLVALPDLVRKKQVRDQLIAGVIIVVGLLVLNRTYYEEGGRNDFQIHFNAGIKQERLGDYVGAAKEYAEADRYYPYSPSLLTNLGWARYKLGEIAEAEKSFNRALAIDPTFHRALNNLGLVLERRGKIDSAMTLYRAALADYKPEAASPEELSRIYVNLASALEQAGMRDSVPITYEKAIAADTNYAPAYYEASGYYARLGEYGQADTLFNFGLAHGHPDAANCFNMGLSLIKRNNFDLALRWLRRSVAQDSTLYQGYYLIAAALYQKGESRDSVLSYLDRTLRINPNFDQALDLQKRLRDNIPNQSAGSR